MTGEYEEETTGRMSQWDGSGADEPAGWQWGGCGLIEQLYGVLLALMGGGGSIRV